MNQFSQASANEASLMHENPIKEDSQKAKSKIKPKKPHIDKLAPYETNLENYLKNEMVAKQKIDPKGLPAHRVFASFSGVIESFQAYFDDEDLQFHYEIFYGEEWHNERQNQWQLKGKSCFCRIRKRKAIISLNFDILLSTTCILSWPQLIITMKGFDSFGNLVSKGYAHMHMTYETGLSTKQATVYKIIRGQKWYNRLFPFLECDCVEFGRNDFQRIIIRGQNRQTQKIKSIGKLFVRTQVILRNLNKFGYK